MDLIEDFITDKDYWEVVQKAVHTSNRKLEAQTRNSA